MFLLRIIEIVLMIVLCVFVLTQFVFPLLTNSPVLWLFRKTAMKEKEFLEGIKSEEETLSEMMILKKEIEKLRKERAEQKGYVEDCLEQDLSKVLNNKERIKKRGAR